MCKGMDRARCTHKGPDEEAPCYPDQEGLLCKDCVYWYDPHAGCDQCGESPCKCDGDWSEQMDWYYEDKAKPYLKDISEAELDRIFYDAFEYTNLGKMQARGQIPQYDSGVAPWAILNPKPYGYYFNANNPVQMDLLMDYVLWTPEEED